MKKEVEDLLQDRVLKNFYLISQIPRSSGHEEEISNFLVRWAAQKGLEAKQDVRYNVQIKKPAAPGYENAPVVMLQAHIDMVCEKAIGSSHDFTKDPIKWVVDGDMITTGGETTLGADNGIGVAYAMAVLEADDLDHPALEAVFTTDEENNFTGALEYDASWIGADYLINLDHGCEEEILLGSCGGTGVKLHLHTEKEKIPQGWNCYKIAVSGLRGGHSGEDIHRGHGNANLLMTRVLRALEKETDYLICYLLGGMLRTAIARDAVCVIALPAECAPKAAAVVQHLEQVFRREYQAVASDFSLVMTETEEYSDGYTPHKLVQTMMLSPDGIWEMSNEVEGLVASSDNMGEIRLEEDGYTIIYEIRCAKDSIRAHIMEVLEILANTVGASYEPFTAYPTWEYHPESKLRAASEEAFYQVFGKEPRELILHAGLECGFFMEKKPELDAISVGPNCWYFHSPDEKLSISSTKRTWEFLVQLLKKLKN
ncbi:MAG: beta-Ala-His dipeptidase [Lachnospiraceae bacterium]